MVLIPTGVYWKECVRIDFGEKSKVRGRITYAGGDFPFTISQVLFGCDAS